MATSRRALLFYQLLRQEPERQDRLRIKLARLREDRSSQMVTCHTSRIINPRLALATGSPPYPLGRRPSWKARQRRRAAMTESGSHLTTADVPNQDYCHEAC